VAGCRWAKLNSAAYTASSRSRSRASCALAMGELVVDLVDHVGVDHQAWPADRRRVSRCMRKCGIVQRSTSPEPCVHEFQR
jgi:hypothetical protein